MTPYFKGLEKRRKDDKIREAYQKAGGNYNVKQVLICITVGCLLGLFTKLMWKFMICPNKFSFFQCI